MRKVSLKPLLLSLLTTASVCSYAYTFSNNVGGSPNQPNGGSQVQTGYFVGMCGTNDKYALVQSIDNIGNFWHAQGNRVFAGPAKIPNKAPLTSIGCIQYSAGNFIYFGDTLGNIYLENTEGILFFMAQPTTNAITAIGASSYSPYVYVGDSKGQVYQAQAGIDTDNWVKYGGDSDGDAVSALTHGSINNISGNTGDFIYKADIKGHTWVSGNWVGAKWVSLGQPTTHPITVLASNLSGNSSQYVYAADDDGDTWLAKVNDSGNAKWLALPAVNHTALTAMVVTGNNQYVYLADNHGNSWVRKNDGNTGAWTPLPRMGSINQIVGLEDSSVIDAVDLYGRVYQRPNNGDSTSPWTYLQTLN